VEEFHTAIFQAEVKRFQITKTQTVRAKAVQLPTASIRAERSSVDAACEIAQRSVA
jgi:hypothetical protein